MWGQGANFSLAVPGYCADTWQVSACHCEERGDVAIRISLRQSITESSTSGEYVRRHEFAPTAAHLPGFSAGMRIATPVCALVRNDMLKTDAFLRVQERFPAVPPGKRRHEANFCLSLRGAKRRGNPHLLAAGHGGGQYFGQIRKALRICPK